MYKLIQVPSMLTVQNAKVHGEGLVFERNGYGGYFKGTRVLKDGIVSITPIKSCHLEAGVYSITPLDPLLENPNLYLLEYASDTLLNVAPYELGVVPNIIRGNVPLAIGTWIKYEGSGIGSPVFALSGSDFYKHINIAITTEAVKPQIVTISWGPSTAEGGENVYTTCIVTKAKPVIFKVWTTAKIASMSITINSVPPDMIYWSMICSYMEPLGT